MYIKERAVSDHVGLPELDVYTAFVLLLTLNKYDAACVILYFQRVLHNLRYTFLRFSRTLIYCVFQIIKINKLEYKSIIKEEIVCYTIQYNQGIIESKVKINETT